MLPNKIKNTETTAKQLKKERLSHPKDGKILTANDLSLLISNNRALVSQIESLRLKNIKRDDIISIFCVLYNVDSFKAEQLAEKKLDITHGGRFDSRHHESWLNNALWDGWKQYTTEELSDRIDKAMLNLHKTIESIHTGYDEPEKISYIAWRTLQAMDANIKANFEIFSLINNIRLSSLSCMDSKSRDNEIEKLFELYDKAETYYKMAYLDNTGNLVVTKDLSYKIDLIMKCISICEESNKILLQLLADSENDLLIESYNTNAKKINYVMGKRYLDIPKLKVSIIQNVASNNDIIQNSMMELIKVLQELNKQKESYSDKIKNAIDDYNDFWVEQMLARREYDEQQTKETQNDSETSGTPLSEEEYKKFQELFGDE